MKIQVLGSGCPTCKKLYEITKEVVDGLENKVELEYLTGIDGTTRIIELGAMSSPAVVVDGKIALLGFSSDKKVILNAIINATKEK